MLSTHLTHPSAPTRWEKNSYGYHGDDGKKYHASGRGEAYGPTFTTGESRHVRALPGRALRGSHGQG
jgi:hypothetical protein